MPVITLVYSSLLIALGLGSYFGLGRQSVTALIPAFFGIPVLICGLLALKEKLLKHAMHAAAMFGVIGILGTFSGLIKALRMIAGATVERPTAVIVQAIMAVLSMIFVGLCVNSFIQIRRARLTEGD
ncbi:MAG: hypothetical protein AAF772_00225 [Acidobacteriota bacterium]